MDKKVNHTKPNNNVTIVTMVKQMIMPDILSIMSPDKAQVQHVTCTS